MTVSQFVTDPLRGATTLWRVAWLYSFVGGAVLEVIALFLVKAGTPTQVVAFIGLGYGTYVTFAAYRCAGNCPWPTFSRLIRLCTLVSLAGVPFFAYLILTDAVTVAT
jgi:hypothetical protein